MKAISLSILLTAMLVALGACTTVNESCEAVGTVRPLCGVQMPEDLEPLPQNGGLLIGEFGNMGHIPGAITWYQPGPGARFVRLVDSNNITLGSGEDWGEKGCPVPDMLSPHGIHLSSRGEKLQLLVVNHSSREHVLFYEVSPSTDTSKPPLLSWRGCVMFPPNAVLNDVAALPDGGFAVTHMYDRGNEQLAQIKSLLGVSLGHVWLWSPEDSITVLPNSKARMPNGIATAEDGLSIWVNNYLEQELRQYRVDNGEILSRVHIPNIDNAAWMPDGQLLIASHLSPLTMSGCFGLTRGTCGSPYELVLVDTKSGTTSVVFTSSDGEPFGPATVAVPYGGKIYMGSFSGDRLGEIDQQGLR